MLCERTHTQFFKHKFLVLQKSVWVLWPTNRSHKKMDADSGTGKWSQCRSAWNLCYREWSAEGDFTGFKDSTAMYTSEFSSHQHSNYAVFSEGALL